MPSKCVVLAAGAAFAVAAAASADSVLQIDVNGLTATAGAGFGTGYTGTLTLSHDADATFNALKIDGVDQPVGAQWSLASFAGSITLSGGVVTGGSFQVDVTDTVVVDTYSASIASGSGMVNTQAGQGFTIDGLTFNGLFGASTFAGIDVSPWHSAQPIGGSFLNFAFMPDAQGVDEDADIDIFAVVPAPGGAGLGLAGLAGLAGLRRRRG